MASIPEGLISLGVGLLGVVLARWVFVNREQRRLGRRERWHETLPITLTGALIAGVVIWDRQLGLSAAAFIGLGVGWATVVILEVAGTRASSALQTLLGAGPARPIPPQADLSGHDGLMLPSDIDTPEDMAKLVDRIDEKDKGSGK